MFYVEPDFIHLFPAARLILRTDGSYLPSFREVLFGIGCKLDSLCFAAPTVVISRVHQPSLFGQVGCYVNDDPANYYFTSIHILPNARIQHAHLPWLVFTHLSEFVGLLFAVTVHCMYRMPHQ